MSRDGFAIAARPTVYRGIQMRSRLEAWFAAYLDNDGSVEWSYEPRAYASRDGQYLPDFEIRANGQRAFIEVRPTWETARDGMAQMPIIWESEPHATLLVYVDELDLFYRAVPGSDSWAPVE